MGDQGRQVKVVLTTCECGKEWMKREYSKNALVHIVLSCLDGKIASASAFDVVHRIDG